MGMLSRLDILHWHDVQPLLEQFNKFDCDRSGHLTKADVIAQIRGEAREPSQPAQPKPVPEQPTPATVEQPKPAAACNGHSNGHSMSGGESYPADRAPPPVLSAEGARRSPAGQVPRTTVFL